MLSDLRKTLDRHPARYFLLGGEDDPLFTWLQRDGQRIDWSKVNDKASAAALAVKASSITCIVAEVNPDGTYHKAQLFPVHVPTARTEENSHIYEDATRMAQPARTVNFKLSKKIVPPLKMEKTGRNELCPCGSGKKFKKCHGG